MWLLYALGGVFLAVLLLTAILTWPEENPAPKPKPAPLVEIVEVS